MTTFNEITAEVMTTIEDLKRSIRRVRCTLQTWDTPTTMDLETLAARVKSRVEELEKMNEENKKRIKELLAAEDDYS